MAPLDERELRELARDLYRAITEEGAIFEHWYYARPETPRYSLWESIYQRVAREVEACPSKPHLPRNRGKVADVDGLTTVGQEDAPFE